MVQKSWFRGYNVDISVSEVVISGKLKTKQTLTKCFLCQNFSFLVILPLNLPISTPFHLSLRSIPHPRAWFFSSESLSLSLAWFLQPQGWLLPARSPQSEIMKVVNLKQAILQAWKERWSDYQWAVNMKKFFPKGATWDILNLAGLKWSRKEGWEG